MLRMATKNVQLSFNDIMFRQTEVVAMGSALGPILANIFVEHNENSLISKNKLSHLYITGTSMMSLRYFYPKMMQIVSS